MIYKLLSFFVIAVLLSGGGNLLAAAQGPQVRANELPHFGLEEGLSNNSITVIFQDQDGFLWIGTKDGLNRYDGYEFRTFRHDPTDENSISGNYIQDITQDRRGDLWIGTRNGGLNKLDYSTGEFTSYMSDSQLNHSLPENSVYGIAEDAGGQLWVKTLNYISLFKGDSIGFENFGHYNNIFNVVDAIRYPIRFESDTSLLVGTKDGINWFNTENKQFTRISSQNAVFDFLPYINGCYMVATASGVSLLEMKEQVALQMLGDTGKEKRVNDILKRENGDILVGTRHGIDTYKSGKGNIPHLSKKGFLGDFQITALMEDHSGIIWIGTSYNGIYKLDFSPPKFNSLAGEYSSKPKVLSSYNFHSVFEDGAGNLWLGTIDKGLYKYHPGRQSVQNFVFDEEAHQQGEDAVFCLFEDRDGKLWAGTSSGLYYYFPPAGNFLKFQEDDNREVMNLLSHNNIYALAQGFDGHLWIGTQFGLYRYNNSGVVSYFHESEGKNGLFGDKVNALHIDEKGNLWIGTSRGLNVWIREEGKIRRIIFDSLNSTSKNVAVISLEVDNEGNILVGKPSGLWIVSGIGETPVLVPETDSLDNDMIKSVITDSDNQTWVGTNKGIAGIKPDGKVQNFDVFDGLPGYVFNDNSVFRNRSGKLFFGCTEGLVWFHPDSISYNQTKPALAFTDIRVVRKGQKTEKYWPLRDVLEVRYQPFTNIKLEYSALEFTNPTRNKYKVFLQGHDPDWRPVTYDNRVSFSNLLPGDYTLKILGSNNDFAWSENPLELEIIVVPPLWMSNYALAFYFLSLIFIIHLFINYRVRHYRQANRELQEKTVNKKQIEAQREVLTRINRSFTDSINYARRIQRAMIPTETVFQNIFPDSFVYLRARDIVSGDFYWFHEKDNKIFVTAVDCTGHGVPGAFMSIIGLDLLKNIVEVQGLESPSEILKSMNGELTRTLHKEQPPISSEDNVTDGMDMSLVVIDRKEKTIEFAGAYNGFYLIRDNEIHSYKGDRYPVGYLKDGESPVFTRKKVDLEEGDVIYMFSDGLPDQFGGPEHKKFKYRRFRLLLLNIHHLPFPDQKAIIHQKIEEWMSGDQEQVDDMLVLGFKPIG